MAVEKIETKFVIQCRRNFDPEGEWNDHSWYADMTKAEGWLENIRFHHDASIWSFRLIKRTITTLDETLEG